MHPVLLCTTKLAQSTSQYYFVPQSLHKEKAFTHSKFFRREAFTHSKLFKQRSFYTQKFLHTTSFYTEKLLYTASFYTQQAFTTIHYDSQLWAAKDKNITQRAAAAKDLDAAITLRFPASRCKPACLDTHGNKTWQQSCSHSTAICNRRFQNTLWLRTRKHTQSSLKPPLQCGKKKANRPQPHPPHTGGTFHRRLQPLYTEKRTVSCSGFLPNTSPMQRSCSHHNAFCSMTWLTRMYLRTWLQSMRTIMQPLQCDLQPEIQETDRTTHAQAHPKQLEATVTVRQKKVSRPQPHPAHTGGTFYRRLQPPYTEKHTVSCSGFLPNTSPMQRSCSHHNAFCSMTWLTRMYLHTWLQSMRTILQPLQCDLQPEIQETDRTTPAQAHPKQLEATVTVRQKKRQTDRSRTRRTQEVLYPTQSPCNINAAITMRFPASQFKPACLDTHGNKTWQQS